MGLFHFLKKIWTKSLFLSYWYIRRHFYMAKRKKRREYPNGGDEMFFYHKATRHPAKQLAHTSKTWTNRRYTHSPNNLSNYKLDESLSTDDNPVYYHKSTFVDTIYKRGRPYDMSQYRKKKKR